ncbi:hypothetical protein F4703DRAFT_1798158 [Phycomyces blakesleeanus]
MTEARVDFIPIRTNKIPSATKKKQETDIIVFLEEQKLIQMQFHMYTRQCQYIMHEYGITNATRKTHFFAVFFSSSYYIIHSRLPFTKYSQYFDFNHNYLKLLMNILEIITKKILLALHNTGRGLLERSFNRKASTIIVHKEESCHP